MRIKVDGTEYEYDGIMSLTNKEAAAVEKQLGVSWAKFRELLADESPAATTAVIWTLKRRVDPDVQFDDVEFRLNDLEVIRDEEEAADAVPLPQVDVPAA